MKKIILALIVIFTISCESNRNKFSLAPIFTDKMVLQQSQSNPIWGTAVPNSEVTLTSSWGEKIVALTEDSGKWILQLPTPEYDKSLHKDGLSFTVSDGKTTIKREDVLIGEVWLASGQSNMEWRMNECDGCVINQDEEIKKSNNDMIRMFSVPQDLSGEKIKSRKWLSANAENTGRFSATAYYFAKKLHEYLDIPIGIVNSSWGGTRIEAWISPQKLKNLDETKDVIKGEYTYAGFDEFYKERNDSIADYFSTKYGYQTYPFPISRRNELWSEYEKKWELLDLGDFDFRDTDFDDSSWEDWKPTYNNFGGLISEGRFEAIFDKEDRLLSNGIIWYRTHVEISDLSKDYYLSVEKGIDDSDQTYFNGKLVGNTYGWSLERRYLIPKELLKKGRNTIAFRVTDPGGDGGFNSLPKLHNDHGSVELPFENFKFKHHAFIPGGTNILVHGYSKSQLDNLAQKERDEVISITPVDLQNQFSAMHENMLLHAMPYGLKGFIWYQGESNVGNYNEYTNLLSGMVEDWRSSWAAELPFYYAQIAPFIYNEILTSQGLRDAQRKALERIKKSGMAVLLDIGEKEDVHPENKKDVGERLSLHALKNEYNFDVTANGPLYKSHVRKGSRIEVSFDYAVNGLVSDGPLSGFEVADDDGIFYPALAQITNQKIIVSSHKVMNPVHVRYGWQNWFVGTLYNSEGLPASSFSSL